MDAKSLFPDSLAPAYRTLRDRLTALDSDVIEEFAKTQVSFGLIRKFTWLSPLTRSKALLTIDMWSEHHDSMLRNVIRVRPDKFTHQIVVQTPAEIEKVDSLGWLAESAAWGRRERPDGNGT